MNPKTESATARHFVGDRPAAAAKGIILEEIGVRDGQVSALILGVVAVVDRSARKGGDIPLKVAAADHRGAFVDIDRPAVEIIRAVANKIGNR